MGKELSKEEILDNVHWQFVVEQGVSSIHTKTFPEAYKQQALKAMEIYAAKVAQIFADQEKKKEAIAFDKWVDEYFKLYLPKEYSYEGLYQLYSSQK